MPWLTCHNLLTAVVNCWQWTSTLTIIYHYHLIYWPLLALSCADLPLFCAPPSYEFLEDTGWSLFPSPWHALAMTQSGRHGSLDLGRSQRFKLRLRYGCFWNQQLTICLGWSANKKITVYPTTSWFRNEKLCFDGEILRCCRLPWHPIQLI